MSNAKLSRESLELHENLRGKMKLQPKIEVKSSKELSLVYSPGVAEPCLAIQQNPKKVYDYTMKGNLVGVVSDGTAVLGLGDIGPKAAMPVMEGKALLLQQLAGVDAMPICLDTKDVDEIVMIVKNIAPTFGAINLEDISAPRCFEIEDRLRKECDIPVFHDDQHGTAIVSLAALINSLKLVKKSLEEIYIVINGAGAAGIAIANLLQTAGVKNIAMCDSVGLITKSRSDLNPEKQAFAIDSTGKTLADAMVGADVFLGVSAPGVVTPAMVKSMAKDPIVFAMANPIPEIQPELITNDVAVMATGRSDYPNQINNVLAFPGIFRGALDSRARTFTTNMYLEAAKAIASLVKPSDLDKEHIVPSVFDPNVAKAVAGAVAHAARQDGVCN